MSPEPTPKPQADAVPTTDAPQSTAAAQAQEPTSCANPAGFEDFDLDDIEVIESKVFA
jgi:hypothetical protein